jgi:BioD-like phosphotransacetylase family protein
MVALYVGSSEPFSGKSLLCIALGMRFKTAGLRVAYYKPLGLLPARVEGVTTDEDAAFINEVLALGQSPETLSGVLMSPDIMAQAFRAQKVDLTESIRSAFDSVARDKDVVLIGGLGSVLYTGMAIGLSAPRLVALLDAQALLIGKYRDERSVDAMLTAHDLLGDRAIGLIINEVPENQLTYVQETVMPFFKGRGIEAIGALPCDRILNSLSVRELADTLNADVLCCHEEVDELVEHFSVGAMSVESALRYFRRTANKAVITGGDRSDLQLAALETSTRCIVLTGDLQPDPRILSRAQEKKVPLLLTRDDTLTTVERIERVLGKLRVREQKKIRRAMELANEHLDLVRLEEKLGLGR